MDRIRVAWPTTTNRPRRYAVVPLDVNLLRQPPAPPAAPAKAKGIAFERRPRT